MKEQNEIKSTLSQIQNTDGGNTKSNAIEIPSISLPKGGGAIKGIDEKFSVNAVNGTSSFSVPLPSSPARGASPSLSLSYNSGAGNSVFGLGWNIGLPSIKRKTDKKLPEYSDETESDIYLFSEAEDLVPEFKKENDGSFSVDASGDYVINERDSPDGLHKIRSYKPRIEGLFARIERWTEISTGYICWLVNTRNNTTTLFGWSPASRIADPSDDRRIYEWLPEFVFDDKSNCSEYIYKSEDDKGFDPWLVHNANRYNNGKITYANLYLSKILYGNQTAYKKFTDPRPAVNDYLFSTEFDYGEYDTNSPFARIKDWDYRSDAFSDYKPGFEIRTTRLCKRVLLFHHFTAAGEYDGLVRSLDLGYDTGTELDFTFLISITSKGYINKSDGSYSAQSYPPMEFAYQKHEWNKEISLISSDNLINAPGGFDEKQYHFTDLYNEGLSGILSEDNGGWYYKSNMGGGKFETARLVSPKPGFAGLGSGLQLGDLNADGGRQFYSYDNSYKGFFELDDDNVWQGFRAFESMPSVNFKDENARFIDLNGDGRPEILISEDNVFTRYESLGKKGFSPAVKTSGSFDEETGAAITFREPLETIFLADMSGDGLTDILRIRNGEISYWPNLGYGRFGNRVTLDNSPVFDEAGAFNPAFIRLADIDGSGTSDIVYLGKNKFTCWKNLSGNRFASEPFVIDSFPEIHPQANITVTDLLGNGVACIVWSSPLAKDTAAPLQYIDLMKSKKPHILNFYKNNFGKEVTLTYTASTKFYLDDKAAGKPWITKLHFPVHCVSRILIEDKITGHQFTSSYTYHHGYYDHPEREFRGFGMVEQTDSEDFENWSKGSANNIVDSELHQEPVITRQWFHTGAFLRNDRILTGFETEYWYEELGRQGFAVVNNEKTLPDARIVPAPGMVQALVDDLNGEEYQQALRAIKGMALRQEVFAHDAPVSPSPAQLKKKLTPYSVATHNCLIELLQPKGKNRYAIFTVKESEAITYSYERDTDDPRIAHTLNVAIDEYGNVLESASVVYPRLNADASLPPETQTAQNKLAIIYSLNKFTNDYIDGDNYRLRVLYENQNFELKGVKKTGSYYSPGDFKDILDDAHSNTAAYHELNKPLNPGKAQRRLIEHFRSFYYKDDLTGPLPLGKQESRGLAFENYQLAYSPELLADIFGPINVAGSRIDDALMTAGKFTHCRDENNVYDSNWWIRSGTIQYISAAETAADAIKRFYVPVSYTDPYGAQTSVQYYSTYYLMIDRMTDALLNASGVLRFNFRTLSPQKMLDPNDNITEIFTNELGFVKALALYGKGNEADDLSGLTDITSPAEDLLTQDFFNAADSVQLVSEGKSLLRRASSRFVHDLDRYINSGGKQPVAVATIVREEHYQANNNPEIQLSFEYSDGLGRVAMKKTQAEPGEAKMVTVNPDDTYTVTVADGSLTNPKQLRWRSSGRQVVNNKGSVVKEYEPYFSAVWHFENQKELVETGVTSISYFDAPGRLVKTTYPDGTLTRSEFDNWKQVSYDQNDTLNDPECSWYLNRTNHLIDAMLIAEGKDPVKEKNAADRALLHANTPLSQHSDTLGRAVLQIENNGKDSLNNDILFFTKIDIDIEGNTRSITDDRGNRVITSSFDMLGHAVYQKSMDAGERFLFQNIMGNPLRTWDSRNHVFSFEYDILHRPLSKKVEGGDGLDPLEPNLLNNIYEKIIYGEGDPAAKAKNLRTKAAVIYDTAGKLETSQLDFKGNLLSSSRRFCQNYKETVDWSIANPDGKLEGDTYSSVFEYNALNRIIQQTSPDNTVFLPHFNEASLLDSVRVTQNGNTDWFVTAISYNEKARRKNITYGNGVNTGYFYDQKTFRLIRLQTRRQNNDPLQDLYYTFDAAGNIIYTEDKNIPAIFFNNQKITGVADYIYDPLYRITAANGREHAGQLNFGIEDNWNDQPFMKSYQQTNPMAWRTYNQQYTYDNVGNIKRMKHTATGGSWTRDYQYENTNNRLQFTAVADSVNIYNYSYPHHPQHGFINQLPQLQIMYWNFKDELHAAAKQKVINGIAETTFYIYDGQGQRARKITERASNGVGNPGRKSQRIYAGGIEIYTEYDNTDTAGLVRTTYHVVDDKKRIAMIETRNGVDDGSPQRLVRYQYGNHLGSASLETDDSPAARVISYEEFHPFGTTSYQAIDKDIKAAYKRYRYTGMERDEESGLEYHGARYYLPWLGRWLSADPAGFVDGKNLYSYSNSNPIRFKDRNGNYSWGDFWDDVKTGVKGAAKGIIEPALIVADFGQMGAALVTHAITGDPDDLDVDFLSSTGNYIKENPNDSFGEIAFHAAIEPNLNIVTGGGYGLGKNIKTAIETGDPDQARHILVQGAAGQVAATAFGSGVSKATGSGWTGRGPSGTPAGDKAALDDLADARKAAGKVKGSVDKPGDATFSAGEGLGGKTAPAESIPKSENLPEGLHAEPQTKADLPSVGGKTITVDQTPCPNCTTQLVPPRLSWLPWNGDLFGSLRVIVGENPAKPGASPKSAMLDYIAGKSDLVPREVIRVPFAPPVIPLNLTSSPGQASPQFRDLGSGFSVTNGSSTTTIKDEDNPYIIPILQANW